MSVSLDASAATVDVVTLHSSSESLKLTVFVRHLGLPPYNNRELPRGQLSCALVPSVLRRVVVATPATIAPFTAHAVTLAIAQHPGAKVDDLLAQVRDRDAGGLELALAWSPAIDSPTSASASAAASVACKCNIAVSLPFCTFTGGLRAFRPPIGTPRYNIHLFGAPGVGKSSLINSILTHADKSDSVTTVAAVGGHARHVTQELTRYRMAEPLHVALWDIWGSTPELFDDAQFAAVLGGTLPSGWHMGADFDAHRPVLDAHASTRVERRAHVVLFVLTVDVLQNESLLAMYRRALACVRAASLDALFVFTKVDAAGIDMNEWAMRVGGTTGGGFFHEQHLALCAALGTNVRTYAISNYVAQEHKNFVIDAHLYQLVHDALSHASHFCRRSPMTNANAAAEDQIPFALNGDGDSDDDLLVCPITHQVMRDPVIAADGFRYERSAIEMWFARVAPNVRSPMTNAPMLATLVDDVQLKARTASQR